MELLFDHDFFAVDDVEAGSGVIGADAVEVVDAFGTGGCIRTENADAIWG